MLEPIRSLYRAARFETWWQRNKNEIVSRQLLPAAFKGTTVTGGGSNPESFGAVVSAEWYQRNGYYRLANALGGRSSYAGKSINADVAFEISAFYAGVKILSEDLGSLPFFLHRRIPGGIEYATDHPLYTVLHDLVNPDLSAGEWVEMMTAHSIFGNGFSRIERNGEGKIMWLFPLMPQEVTIARNSTNRLYYVHSAKGQGDKTYSADQIFHLRGFTLNGESGDDLLYRARHALGLAAVGQEYASRFFANNATPSIAIEFPAGTFGTGPGAATQIQNFKDAWRAWHQGPNHWHEPAVVQNGKVTTIESDNQKSQLIEQRTFQILEVCRYLRLQPYKLAEFGRATWANAEQQQIDYVSHSLGPLTRRWRQAVYRCLFTRAEQVENELYAEHALEALQRGDFTAQSTGFARLLERGVYTINEVRKWYNLNPIEGGDQAFIQLNMTPVADAAELAQAQLDQATQQKQKTEATNAEVTPQQQKVTPMIRRIGSNAN